MKEPTKAQQERFWKWCGLPYEGYGNSNRQKAENPPPIDLNNLFKYAVPKLHKLNYLVAIHDDSPKWSVSIMENVSPFAFKCSALNKDPALALFWALWQIMEGK